MSFSILARCARTGQVGFAMASDSVAIGQYNDGSLRAGAGGSITQGSPAPRNNRLATGLLAQGARVSHVIRELIAVDPDASSRQIAVIDREGEVQVHSGSALRPISAHRSGRGYAVLGDMLSTESVLDAMVARFESTADDELEARLIDVLEAGRDAGGLHGAGGPRAVRSVAMAVWGIRDYSDLDLRVDLHDVDAIAEIRRTYADYKPSAAYYEERARHPQNAIPAMEFADMLRRGVVGLAGGEK